MNNTTDTTSEVSGKSKRGFASMPPEKVHEIASKGGHASAQKAGHEGMAERGHEGGVASTQAASHEELSERGHKGGIASGEARRQAKTNRASDDEEE